MRRLKRFNVKNNTLIPIILGLIVQTTIALTYVHTLKDADNPFQQIALIFTDWRIQAVDYLDRRNRDNQEISSNVVIVEIDEKSLREEGRWPWTRSRIGELFERMYDAGAATIGVDVFFTELEKNPIDYVLQKKSQFISEEMKHSLNQARTEYDPDLIFGQILQDKPDIVLGVILNKSDSSESRGFIGKPIPNSLTLADKEVIPSFSGYIGIIDALKDHSAAQGVAITEPDRDGRLRQYPLVFNLNGEIYPSLGLKMAVSYLLGTEVILAPAPELGGLESITLDASNQVIETDRKGRVLIPFHGRSREYFEYVSASDILNRDDWQSKIADKIVLVGATTLGLQDLRGTPLENQFPGVEVHANVVESLVNESYSPPKGWLSGLLKIISPSEHAISAKVKQGEGQRLEKARANIRYQTRHAGVVVEAGLWLCLILAFVLPRCKAISVVLIGVVSTGVIVYLDFAFFYQLYVLVDLSPLVGSILSLVILNIGYGFYIEQKGRMKVTDVMGQYVPSAHIGKLMEEDLDALMKGDNRELSVLFCDIRSFTTISESMTANELKQMLNAFFTPMTKIIFDQHGTIDKYVGDMIMAFWGAPIESASHANDAVVAALQMLQKVQDIKPEFAKKGYPNVEIGIGVNTGPMNVGDMGSKYRRAYTVLGDAVNLGSRLEGLTKDYGIGLLIGEETFKQLTTVVCRRLDRVKVKGKDNAIQVYQPVCLKTALTDEIQLELENHHQALDAYLLQEWKVSRERFQALFILYQRPMYQLYLNRIDQLEKANLPPTWDGVYVKTSK